TLLCWRRSTSNSMGSKFSSSRLGRDGPQLIGDTLDRHGISEMRFPLDDEGSSQAANRIVGERAIEQTVDDKAATDLGGDFGTERDAAACRGASDGQRV